MKESMITTERAREIAANLDVFVADDIQDFLTYVGFGVRPLAQAAALFPNERVETIEGYKPTAPIGRLAVTKTLRNYGWNKVTAIRLREKGQIAIAMEYEVICERLYNSLPTWAKW